MQLCIIMLLFALAILGSGKSQKSKIIDQHLTPSTISSVAALLPRGFAWPGKRSQAHPHLPMDSSTRPLANVLYWKTLDAIWREEGEENTHGLELLSNSKLKLLLAA